MEKPERFTKPKGKELKCTMKTSEKIFFHGAAKYNMK